MTSETVGNIRERSLGVALSGGGLRATLFSLGALNYLVAAGLHREVKDLTSVSGGSIANAILATHPTDFSALTLDEMNAISHRAGRFLARYGSFFLPRFRTFLGTMLRSILILMLYPVLMTLFFTFGGSWDWEVFGFLALMYVIPMLILAALLPVILRKSVQVGTYAKVLAAVQSGDDRPHARDVKRHGQVRLAGLPPSAVRHVMCGTEINSGRPMYFSRDFTASPVFGRFEASTLVCEAMYASAAFPGVFPPLVVKPSKLRIVAGLGSQVRPKRYVLNDGGVFNNLGTDWFDDAPSLPTADLREAQDRAIDEIVVVNASSPPDPRVLSNVWPIKRPVWFVRTILVLYENTVTPRLAALRRDPRIWAGGRAYPCVVIDIAQPPEALISPLAASDDPVVRGRAEATLAAIRANEGVAAYLRWSAEETSRTPTTLSPIGEEQASRLLRHGYMAAALVCSVRYGTPGLSSVPTADWFDRLTRREHGSADQVDAAPPVADPAAGPVTA